MPFTIHQRYINIRLSAPFQISGNNVVWSEPNRINSTIYLDNGDTTIQIPTNRFSDQLKISGNNLVWVDSDGTDHVKAGDVVKFTLSKDRKRVTKGEYTARVKTPTEKGFEVLINGARIAVSSMNDVTFVHMSDGYGYQFGNVQIDSKILQ